MTSTRNSNKHDARKQDEAESARRPKLNKERLRDLTAGNEGEAVRGGRRAIDTQYCDKGGDTGKDI